MLPNSEFLTELIEELPEKERPAGVSVAVTDRNGICFRTAFGVENVERPSVANEVDALYRVASITKIAVSVLIHRLVEQGEICLNEKVKTYLPNLTLSCLEAEEQLTVYHLLTHTGGFATEEWLAEGTRDETAIESELLNEVAQLPMLTFPSDEVYRYSNAGYNLLALITSKVSGKPFTELMSELVLRPLGMEKSTFDFHVAATYPLSQPHTRDKNGELRTMHYQRMNAIYHGAGGLFSNASELCALARLFLNGGVTDAGERLLSEASVESILKKRYRRNDYEYYGLGMFIREKDGHRLYGHTGNYSPYNSSLFFDKDSAFGVATLINTANCEPLRYIIPERIFEMLKGL